METVTIALVDDHKMFRDGIQSVLSNTKDFIIVSDFNSGEELLDYLETKEIDILITDISLPGLSGIDLCRKVTEKFPAIKTIILSMHTKHEFILSALQSGAKGYLPKDSGHEELIKALKSVSNNEIYFNHNISQNIIKEVFVNKKNDNQNPFDVLSKREIEVLKHFAEGFTNKEISEKLFISIRTVESHKTHILSKLGFRSNVDLVKYAIKHKIITL
jgi:DNA-binding NarL/FixJ family response regulator